MREEERAVAAQAAGPDGSSRGFLVLLIAGSCVGLALLFGFLASLVSESWRTGGTIAGAAAGLVMGVVFFRGFGQFERELRDRSAADLAEGEVEEIVVECDAVVAIEADHSSLIPALALEIGDDDLLVLAGQWLGDPPLYGSDVTEADDALEGFEEIWWNGLRPPHAFPTRRFTVVRFSASGDVLAIRPEGEYLAPARTVPFDLGRYNPQPSQVLKGTLSELDRALPPRPA